MFCRYCGTKLLDTAKFCKSCGKATAKTPTKTSEINHPEPIAKTTEINHPKEPTYKTNNMGFEAKTSIDPNVRLQSKKSRGFFKIFAPVISIVLIGAIAFHYLGPFDLPGIDEFGMSKITHDNLVETQILPKVEYTKKELSAKGQTALVSQEQTLANFDGISIDFGDCNLSESKNLDVVSLPIKVDEDAGVEFQAYEIELEDMKEFNTLVDITLSYNPTGLTEEEQKTAITIAWFDKDRDIWIPLVSKVDTVSQTVSFSTDHFSLFSILKNTTNKGKAVFYYPNNEYKGVNTPIKLDSGALIPFLDKVDTKPFELLLKDRSVPTKDLLSTGAGYLNTITSSADEVSQLSSRLLPSIMKAGEAVGSRFALLGTAAVSLKMSNQLIKGVPFSMILRDNAFNLVEIVLIVALSVKASPFLATAATAVWIGGIVDDMTYDSQDITTYVDLVEKCYDYFSMRQITYNTETGTCGYIIPMPGKSNKLRSGEVMLSTRTDWARILRQIQKDNANSPQLIKDKVNKLVESYSLAFWKAYTDNYANVFYWLDEQKVLESGKLSETLDWPKSKDEIQKYITRTIIRSHDRLQTVYKEMAEVENHQLGVKYTLAAMDLADSLNQTIYFEAVDPTLEKPGFAKSVHASKYLSFYNEGYSLDDFVASERSSDSNIIFRCNLYHYLMAGSPTQLEVYPFAPSETAMPIRDRLIPFSFASPTTKIEFPAENQQGEILGQWNIYSNYSNNGFFAPPGITEEGLEAFNKEHNIVGEPEQRGFKMVFYPDNTFYAEIRSEASVIDSSFSGTYKAIEIEGASKGSFHYLADIDETTIINKGQMIYSNVGEGPDLKFYFKEKDGVILLFEETTQIYLQ